MDNHQPTVDDESTAVLTPETSEALALLLALAGPAPAQRRLAPTVSATDEFAASRVSHPRGGRPGREYPRVSTVVVRRADGICSACGDRWDKHWDSVAGRYIDGAEWHARDAVPHAETQAVQR